MKGRANSNEYFCAFPHSIFQSPQFAMLSPRAVKALVDIYMQYRGLNNGDLSAHWKLMYTRGWRGKGQLAKAVHELEERGWIVKTRQGGRKMATLYAVTFRGIDFCGGKLDSGVKYDPRPLHLWKLPDYATLPVVRALRGRDRKNLLPRGTGQTTPSDGPKVVAISSQYPVGQASRGDFR
jgi:hypothetical protein